MTVIAYLVASLLWSIFWGLVGAALTHTYLEGSSHDDT